MTFHLEVLRKRWEEMQVNLALLDDAAALPLSEFSTTADKVEATMFRLIVCIETAQAICFHLCARVSTATPDSPASCFESLAKSGLFSDELAVSLASLCRFRNLLVHRYWSIDAQQVHSFLPEGIRDLRTYTESTMRYAGGQA